MSIFVSCLMSISTLGASFCVLVLPVGDAGTITHSSVLFTIILARLILETPISLWKLFWTILLCIGLMLVVKPTLLFRATQAEGESKASMEQASTCSWIQHFIGLHLEHVFGVTAGLFAAFCYSLIVVLLSAHLKELDSFTFSGLSGICGISVWPVLFLTKINLLQEEVRIEPGYCLFLLLGEFSETKKPTHSSAGPSGTYFR